MTRRTRVAATGISRRDFIGYTSAVAATAGSTGFARRSLAQSSTMPTRPIPVSGEELPVVGLGSSKVVSEIATHGPEPLANVLQMLVEHGGRVVDTWPRNAQNDAAFGSVIDAPQLRGQLFVTTKIDQPGREAGIEQFRETQRLYGRDTIDLAQIFSLTDLETHWPSLQQWKAEGSARYIGVTVAEYELYDRLERFLERERPDFVQMNYSITERGAEERLLPLAADRGAAVLINRPFMNGAYFRRLANEPLPDWTADFDCHSWAQFSLKYILAHPAITTVLTETSNPEHMEENAQTAFGPVPDEAARQRMREYIDAV